MMSHDLPAAISLRVSPARYPGLVTVLASLGLAVMVDDPATVGRPMLLDDPAACRDLRSSQEAPLAILGLVPAGDEAAIEALAAAGADDLLSWPAPAALLRLRLELLWQAHRWRSHGPRLGGLLPSLAHDVRLPLFSVRGYAGLLRDGSLGPVTSEQSEAADIMIGAVGRVERLLDDVQSLAHLEAGVLAPELAPLLLHSVAQQAVRLMSGLAASTHVTVKLQLEGEQRVIDGDASLLERAIGNLLSNAIGHSAAGGQVELQVRYGPTAVHLSVTDHGPGLATADQAAIFERYYRTRSGSIVLGLSIARELIEMHHGRIWVRSEPGSGATFEFELPYAPDPSAASPAP